MRPLPPIYTIRWIDGRPYYYAPPQGGPRNSALEPVVPLKQKEISMADFNEERYITNLNAHWALENKKLIKVRNDCYIFTMLEGTKTTFLEFKTFDDFYESLMWGSAKGTELTPAQ